MLLAEAIVAICWAAFVRNSMRPFHSRPDVTTLALPSGGLSESGSIKVTMPSVPGTVMFKTARTLIPEGTLESVYELGAPVGREALLTSWLAVVQINCLV